MTKRIFHTKYSSPTDMAILPLVLVLDGGERFSIDLLFENRNGNEC